MRTLAHEGSRKESRSAGLLTPAPLPPYPLPPLRVPHSPSILGQTVSVHSQFEQQNEELFVWRIGYNRSQNKQGKKNRALFM